MNPYSKSNSSEQIIIADIEFLSISIDWDRSCLSIEFKIGSKPFTSTIQLSNSYFMESLDSYGVIFHIELFDVDYTLFITSHDLNLKLSAPSIESNENTIIEVNNWFIEIQKSFQKYKICFTRQIKEYRRDKLLRSYFNNDNIFKGFYFSDPAFPRDQKRFMLLNIPTGKSKLIEILKHPLTFKSYDFDILIGDFVLESSYCFAYIFQIENLNVLSSEKEFKIFHHFTYKGKKLPIPSLPITKLSEFNSTRIDLYTSHITRSLVLCLFISSELSIPLINSESDEVIIDENELIAISDTSLNENYWSIYEHKDMNLSPYKTLVYPYDSRSTLLEFLNGLPDYDKALTSVPDDRTKETDFYETKNTALLSR